MHVEPDQERRAETDREPDDADQHERARARHVARGEMQVVADHRELTRAYSSSIFLGGMSSGRSVHFISGQTCTRDLKRQPSAVFTSVSS